MITKYVPGRVAADASSLYSRNLLNFLTPFIDADSVSLALDWEDELVAGTLITRDGGIVHPMLAGPGVAQEQAI